MLIYIMCEDNSTLIYEPNGKQISTIYPPPTAKELLVVEYSMFLNRFFILLASGTICIYKFDKETAILEKLQYPNQLKDSEGRAMSQIITTLGFCNVMPPRYDWEIVREGSHVQEDFCEETKSKNIMVLGFNKGTFVFVDLKNLESIYARFSIHRHSISKIQQLNNKGIFVSICTGLTMNIWGFTSSNIIIYKTIDIFRPIKDIYSDNQTIFLSFESNDLELLQWNEQLKELEIFHKDKKDDHSGRVNWIDSTKASCKIIN